MGTKKERCAGISSYVGPANPVPEDPAASLEAEVDHALSLCDGEPRATIRGLLLMVKHLEEQAQRISAAVSRGYVRGDLYHRLTHADSRPRRYHHCIIICRAGV